MQPKQFMDAYTAVSGASVNKPSIEAGNKSIQLFLFAHPFTIVILPPNALKRLSQLNLSYPMFFRVSVPSVKRRIFCGVLEFVAEEGKCYLPDWMMKQFDIKESENVIITNVKLPKGSFAKLQPFETKFSQLSNPKAMLPFQSSLRTNKKIDWNMH